MIDILYEDNHLLVVCKPCNMIVQQDNTNDEDLLSYLKKYLKEKYQKTGNVYLGLVHRLDRPVGGVMVFAKTSKAASRLSKSIVERSCEKWYLAVVEGKMEKPSDTLVDYLKKNHQTNFTYVTDKSHGKFSSLAYEVLGYQDQKSLLRVILHTGRSHQIRVQFASRNHPLVFDQRYHPSPKKGQIALWAYHLAIEHPITREKMVFEMIPKAEIFQKFEVRL